jgi:hypothetical protein
MRKSWLYALWAILLIGFVLAARYLPKQVVVGVTPATTPKCPASDVIIYIKEPPDNAYSCATEGQQPTLVRQPGYTTYILCSCSK